MRKRSNFNFCNINSYLLTLLLELTRETMTVFKVFRGNSFKVLPRSFPLKMVHQTWHFWLQESNISFTASRVHHIYLWTKLGRVEPKKLLHLVFGPNYRGGQPPDLPHEFTGRFHQKTQRENYSMLLPYKATQVDDIIMNVCYSPVKIIITFSSSIHPDITNQPGLHFKSAWYWYTPTNLQIA